MVQITMEQFGYNSYQFWFYSTKSTWTSTAFGLLSFFYLNQQKLVVLIIIGKFDKRKLVPCFLIWLYSLDLPLQACIADKINKFIQHNFAHWALPALIPVCLVVWYLSFPLTIMSRWCKKYECWVYRISQWSVDSINTVPH